ncbi:LacI family DNA-binding transcriptional regulator [Georgenia subflava]|uniref:LacI family DNA-binding transcriptional regulator n=1 Tax=Georgenia subflava TaxID=1622177 RepID=A0A6N7EFI1_9MICO|nr:LacI family DNA-binding transcriptional regulator [Georgenia subflava]MPV35455.1 LacI family DNA-binding transcriptional regulator [Georgenia subflava]
MTTTGHAPEHRRSGRRPTQADVARIAGVSQTTVSMVLTGTGTAQRRVGEDARERVLRAIEVTGYAANPFAQRLAGGRTSIVGVYTYESVFPHDSSDFYHPFLEGVENEAQRSGVDLLMFTSMSATRGQQLVGGGGVGRLRLADGCVLLGRHSYPEDLAELLRQDFPFAFVGRREAPGGKVPYAGAAYDVATQQVVENLLTLGHRRIVLVNEFTGHESIEDRARGYRRAMTRAGLQPVTFDEPDLTSGELLDALRSAGVSAVVVTSDLAAPLRRAAVARGLAVPGDLSIARLGDPERPDPDDDVDWTGFLIPRQEMGAEALRIVIRQLTPTPDPPEELQIKIPCVVVPGVTAARHQPSAARPVPNGKVR